MTTFDDRKDSFERKFAHDAELQFKVDARRNKLLGLWAAGLMGKSGEEATSYALDVVRANFAEPGDEDVFRKVAGDLGDLADEPTIRVRMSALMIEARNQIMSEV
ncbi:MAG: DUF1476 domain-containing protein [Rubellimicrobium sp.]|nr:DUF1476 domain-containing protein [Rubellimicrobium sp.]